MNVYARIARLIQRHPWAVIGVCLAITVALGLGLLSLKVEASYEALLPRDFPSVRALAELRQEFGGIAYESVLIRAPSVTDKKVVEFLVGLEDFINEDPRFNKGQVATVPGKKGPGVPRILSKPVPVVRHYLTPFVANVKKGVAEFGVDIALSSISDDMIRAQTGKGFKQTVEEDYLSNPEVQKSMVGEQKFINPGYTSALVMLKIGAGLTQEQQIALAGDIEGLFHEKLSGVEGLKMYFAGDPTLARDFRKHIWNRTLILFAVAMGLVLLTLFLAFRRFSDTLLPVAFMLIGLVWTLGLMGWAGIPFSVASIALTPLLLGTALTFVVPFVARYYEEIQQHFRSVQAVGKAVITVGVAIFLAAITNFFGFMVFEFSVLPPLRDFGLTCACGTLFIFLLSITLLPSIMVLRDRVSERGFAERTEESVHHFDGLSRRRRRGLFAKGTDRILEAFNTLSVHHSMPVILLFAALILLGFSQIRGLKTDSDLRRLVPQTLPGILADFEIEKDFGGRQSDVVLVKGDVMSSRSLDAMARFEDAVAEAESNRHESQELYPRNAIIGLPDALADANGGRLPVDRDEAERAVKTAEDNGGFIVGGLLSEDRDAAIINLNGWGAQSPDVVNRKMGLLRKYSERYLKPAGLDYELGGITPITKDLTRNIIPTETVSSGLALALCAVILIIIFRSFAYGLITLTVAFAGVAAEIGFLSLMNWPLDVITSLASALVIGVGVNFGILFTHRYIQEMKVADREPVDAIKTTMMNLGRANVVAALATVAAFAIIMFTGIVPLRRFGGVTAFAIGWCLVTSLTLMPALLCRLSHHQARDMPEPSYSEQPEPAGS